jgi:hypothetical protein
MCYYNPTVVHILFAPPWARLVVSARCQTSVVTLTRRQPDPRLTSRARCNELARTRADSSRAHHYSKARAVNQLDLAVGYRNTVIGPRFPLEFVAGQSLLDNPQQSLEVAGATIVMASSLEQVRQLNFIKNYITRNNPANTLDQFKDFRNGIAHGYCLGRRFLAETEEFWTSPDITAFLEACRVQLVRCWNNLDQGTKREDIDNWLLQPNLRTTTDLSPQSVDRNPHDVVAELYELVALCGLRCGSLGVEWQRIIG